MIEATEKNEVEVARALLKAGWLINPDDYATPKDEKRKDGIEVELSGDDQFLCPFTGKLVTSVKWHDRLIRSLHIDEETGRGAVLRVPMCRHTTGGASTPPFFLLDDLKAYCEIMRKTLLAEPVVTYNMFDPSPPKLTGAVKLAGTVHGLYAIVGESGMQCGPLSESGYATYIEKVLLIENAAQLEEWQGIVTDLNKNRDLPARLQRVDIRLW